MAFQVSPGVSVTEKDLTNVIPAVSTTSGGIVITAEKGPIDEITTISSEKAISRYTLGNQLLITLKNGLLLRTF